MATTIDAAKLLVAALENEGVEAVHGVPGEENLDLLEALRTSSIRLILTRHEQGAASWRRPTAGSPAGPECAWPLSARGRPTW